MKMTKKMNISQHCYLHRIADKNKIPYVLKLFPVFFWFCFWRGGGIKTTFIPTPLHTGRCIPLQTTIRNGTWCNNLIPTQYLQQKPKDCSNIQSQSLSGKMNIQIPCFPCAPAILLHVTSCNKVQSTTHNKITQTRYPKLSGFELLSVCILLNSATDFLYFTKDILNIS